MIRVGIVGLGFGRFHAATLAGIPAVKVVALCQAHETEPPLDVLAEHYRARAYRDVDTMLRRERLQLVCVCTRPSRHLEVTRAAVSRGCAVLVEKPLAGDLKQAQDLCDLVIASGAWVAVNFELRWLAPVQRLRRLIDEGELGRPLLLDLSYVMDPVPNSSWMWQTQEGGGPIWENACHAVDLARYLMGEIEVVASRVANLRGGPGDDCAIVTLQTVGGALVNLVTGAVGTKARRVPMHLELYGSHGQASLTGHEHEFTGLTYGTASGAVSSQGEAAPAPTARGGPYAVLSVLDPGLRRVVRELRSGHPPGASVHDALVATSLVQAALAKSASAARSD